MKSKKRIVIVAAIFLVGLLIGFYVGNTYVSTVIVPDRVKLAIEGASWLHIKHESTDLAYAYYFSPPETGIYALKHYIGYLEHYKGKDLALLDDSSVFSDQASAAVRIGFLHETLGDTELAEEFYTYGVDLYKQSGKKDISKEKLIEQTRFIDDYFKDKYESKGLGPDTPEEVVYEYFHADVSEAP